MKPEKYFILLLLIFSSIIVRSQSEKKESEYDKLNLKGKVRSVLVTSYEVKVENGKPVKGEMKAEKYSSLQKKYVFNADSHIVIKEFIGKDHAVEDRILYDYDQKGRLKKNTYQSMTDDYTNTIYYDAFGRRIEKNGDYSGEANTFWFYDDKGNLIKEVECLQRYDEVMLKVKRSGYEFDEAGLQTETLDYAPKTLQFQVTSDKIDRNIIDSLSNYPLSESDVYFKRLEDHDSKGNVIRRKSFYLAEPGEEDSDELAEFSEPRHYVKDGVWKSNPYSEWVYDGNNIVKERLDYDTDDQLFSHYIYNTDGNVLMRKGYAHDGSIKETYSFSYNQNGDLTNGKIIFSDNSTIEIINNQYDQMGNPVEEKKMNTKGEVTKWISYSYRYDESGNWIERIKYVDGNPTFIRVRDIEYF